MAKKKGRLPQLKRGQQHKTAVVCDSYDQTAFASLKEKSTKLTELEEGGSHKLPTFPPLMQDVYSSLYKATPKLREAKAITPSHRYNRSLIEQLMKTEQFKELRTYTQLDEFNAAMATLSLAASALELIPEETQEKLQEMNNLEEQSENLQDQLDGLQEAAQQAKQQAGNLEQQAQQAKGQGNKAEAQNLQAQANQLSSQAQNLEAQASGVQMSLEEAKSKLDGLDEELAEDLQKNQTKLRQAARKAAEEALADVKETSEFLEAWGSETGEVKELPFEEKIRRAELIRSSHKMRELSKLVGRFKRLALNTQKTKVKEAKTEVFDVVRGSDLDRVLPSELEGLTHSTMRLDFYRRYADGNLLLFDLKDKDKEGKGPIIICCDNSGSMEGSKELWSKAVALALLEISKLQKRNYACIHFGSDSDPIKIIEVPKGQVSFDKALEIGQYFLNGGTDFMKPLTEAVALIEKSEFKKADIVFVTDGECAVTDEFLERFREVKKQKEFRVISVLVDMGSTTPAAVREFSDEVKFVSEMSQAEAGEIFASV
jgi:uncharacterized protein with von Willebrand factor type A (vWA) domain